MLGADPMPWHLILAQVAHHNLHGSLKLDIPNKHRQAALGHVILDGQLHPHQRIH